MKKIIIRLQANSLFFSYQHNKNIREDLMNTNIISDSELIFSDDYILDNSQIVMPFFKELCDMNKINTLTFQNCEIACFMLKYFKGIKLIEKIRIKKEENISYALCEELISFKTAKQLECYSIPNFMLELLDKHHIIVFTKSEVFYISPFMQRNHITDYTTIFYKKEIEIFTPMTEEDQEDLKTFLSINHYLKVIKFKILNRQDLEYVLKVLKEYRYKNIYIELYQDILEPKDILYLRELNRLNKKRKIIIELNYSEEYLNRNLFKQISLNTLKVCGLILISIVVGSFGYVFVRNYISMQEVSQIQEQVNNTISKVDEIVEEEPKENESALQIKNRYIDALTSINPDVVGYLKVKNTNVDYPVVLGTDNVFYLEHNLYKEYDQNGWIYMDFRNSVTSLNDNTIIYGHNMYYSGVMFGTLHRVLNSNWQDDPNNLIISFNTAYETMNWQIFSIYTIPKTSDYLRVSFDDETDKMNYINMVKNRSKRDYQQEVTANDKILTLSTCTGNNARLVIHAKLLPS